MDIKDKLTKVLAEYKSLGIAEQIDYADFRNNLFVLHKKV